MRLLKSSLLFLIILAIPVYLSAQEYKVGDDAHGIYKYDDFEKPMKCRSCHIDIYEQWNQAMMSVAYTHHWDEIEYFQLAIPHAEKDPKVAEVKDGCNGCHTPIAFFAGDTPPPLPSENSRANESVSCDVCHTIQGFVGDIPHNFNFISTPGKTKFGNREGVESPEHVTQYSDFVHSADFCGVCHNEMSPYGVWVKSTHLEWKEGEYFKQGVRCQDCHMPGAPGRNALMAKEEYDDVAQHLFHGAHSPAKLRGSVEVRIHPDTRETEPGMPVVLKVVLHNAKAGHKIPSGSVEDRIVWLHVEAVDSEGRTYHLPVDKKGFPGEEYTIASEALAYQDFGDILDIPDFQGIPRDGVPIGDRIFRMPYFDPQGRMTICQWNTASLGTDYRIGPRETKIEKFTWELPDDLPEGEVKVIARLYYSRLVNPVADYLNVPEDEKEHVLINETMTTFEIFW
ncbi:multiheme c-type cytochrome [candidate division KSB1 bacterium]